jgi:nucleosome binding factor SPN SPT16 subunit
MNRDELDDDDRDNDADATDNDELPEEYENMSEMDMEFFLADAVDAYAEDQGIPDLSFSTVPFRRAGLLTQERGLVIRIGDAEFQVRIVRVD